MPLGEAVAHLEGRELANTEGAPPIAKDRDPHDMERATE